MGIKIKGDRANKFASDKLERLIVSAPSEEDRDNVIQFYDLMHKMICVGFVGADTDREKLVEALRFYASLDNWTEEDGGVYDGKTAISSLDCESLTFVCNDDENPSTDTFGGKLARTTLKELGEME